MGHSKHDLGRVAGENLRRLMKERGMTQEDFAYEFGVSVRTVQRWVSGKIYDLRQIQQIADFFGVEAIAVLTP